MPKIAKWLACIFVAVTIAVSAAMLLMMAFEWHDLSSPAALKDEASINIAKARFLAAKARTDAVLAPIDRLVVVLQAIGATVLAYVFAHAIGIRLSKGSSSGQVPPQESQ